MSRYQKNKIYEIETLYGGINNKTNSRLIKPEECETADDVSFDELGSIQSRHEDETFSSLTDVFSIHKFKKEYIVSTGNGLYSIDANGSYNLIDSELSGKTWGQRYGDFFYVTNGNIFKKYNGDTSNCGIVRPSSEPSITLRGTTVVDRCDTVWTGGTGVTAEIDSSVLKEGSGSSKLTTAAEYVAGSVLGYHAVTSVDLSSATSIGFWFLSDSQINAGDIQLLLSDTAAVANPIETLDLPEIATANIWQYVALDLVNPSLLTAIISVGLKATLTLDPTIMHIDILEAGSGPLEGSYLWYSSFLSEHGFESAMSDASTTNTQSIDRKTARVACQISSDPQVEKINIYRSGGSIGSTKYFVGDLDNTPDQSLSFTSGSAKPKEGDILRGQTSETSCTCKYVDTLTSGSWDDGDAVGVIRIQDINGRFQAGELVANRTDAAANVLTLAASNNGKAIIEDDCDEPPFQQDDCDSDSTSDWTLSAGGDSLAFVTDHYVWTNQAAGHCYLASIAISSSKTYTIQVWLKDGTGAPTDLKLFFYDGTAFNYSSAINTTGSFVQNVYTVTPSNTTTGSGKVGLYLPNHLSGNNVEFKLFAVYDNNRTERWTLSDTDNDMLKPDTDHYHLYTNTAADYCYFTAFDVDRNKAYKMSIDLKDGTATPTDAKLFFYDGLEYTYSDAINTTGAFVTNTLTVHPDNSSTGSGLAGIYLPTTLGGAYMEMKDFTLYDITPTEPLTNAMFFDQTPDEDLTTPAENEDNSEPQTIGKYLQECDSRFWMADGDTIYMSRAGAYREAWPLSYYITFPDDVTGMVNINESMIVFTKSSTWKVIGDQPSNYERHELNWESVCLSHDSIATFRTYGVCRSRNSIYMVSSDDIPIMAGEKVTDLFLNDGRNSSGAVSGYKYYVTNGSKVIVADLLYAPNSIIFSELDLDCKSFFYDLENNITLYSDFTAIKKLSSSSTDVAFDWRKNSIHFDKPGAYKYLRKIWINYNGDVTLNIYSDGSSTADATITGDTTTVTTKKEFSIPYNVIGNVFDIDIDATGIIEPPITFLFVPCIPQ